MADKKNDAKTKSAENLSKRGKKGGTRFPNYSLKQLLSSLKELTSKTYTKPITIEQLNAGVFKMGANSPEGKIKFSSLKQFSLAEGEYKTITATELAKKIVLAVDDNEKTKYLRTAFFNVPSFQNTFETFQGSRVNKAKIKSYSVSTLKIHLDLSDKFVKAVLDSAETASICVIEGDDVTFVNDQNVYSNNQTNTEQGEYLGEGGESNNMDELNDDMLDNESKNENTEYNVNETPHRSTRKAMSTPNIAFQIDSTLDPDKLAKQLSILRKYGLI